MTDSFEWNNVEDPHFGLKIISIHSLKVHMISMLSESIQRKMKILIGYLAIYDSRNTKQASFSLSFFNLATKMNKDDILKKRREEQKKAKREESKQRQPVKSNTGKKTKTPTTTQKSVGANKAKRGAKVNARRGISTTEKATKMEVEKEIGRQQRGGKGNNTTRRNQNKQTSGSSGRTVADRKMKAKNVAGTKQNHPKQAGQKTVAAAAPPPPPQKAVKAALNAMKEVGYNVPKGVKMVVSFVSGQSGGNQNKGPSPKKSGNQQRDKGKQQNQKQNQSKSNNNNKRGRR